MASLVPSTDWTPFVLAVALLLVIPGVSIGADTGVGEWEPSLKFSASMTSVGAAHTDNYPGVSGISGTEENFSWIAGFNGRMKREFQYFSQDHRLEMKYGKTDGEESQDEIDFNNIIRYSFYKPTFVYGNARVRSSFDTFGHPTSFNSSLGVGTRMLDSDTYGILELRTGPRIGRDWNPHTDWEGLYELVMEYEKQFGGNSDFQSQLESYTLLDEPDEYTVRWENTLTASVNSWLDVEYNFTMYYEDVVGEVATKNVSTVNLVYRVY